jgi:hypothetical protein
MKQSRSALVVALSLALAAAGCSGFSREWQEATRQRPAKWSGIEGPWSGHWVSGKTGHRGGLRCVVRRSSEAGMKLEGASSHQFHYHATWAKVLGGSFKTSQPVRETRPGQFVSEGDWTLPGWAGGSYHYRVDATPVEWRATYRSSGDHGRFEMRRPVQ